MCVWVGIQDLEGWYFWSIKTDLFFIVNSYFWVTIQVDVGRAWISGLWCRWMGIQDLEDRCFGQLRVDFMFHCNFQVLGYNSGGVGRAWISGL